MSAGDDRVVIESQLGRPIRAASEVVSRCHLGLPVVVKVPPRLDDGTPFPTLYWLTCPLAITRIGRLEGSGGVKRMEAKADADPDFGAALTAANSAYEAEREELLADESGPRPSGGVGGTGEGVKCLHAHFAHYAASRENPIGELVSTWIGPLDCEVPCVSDGKPNPEWVNRP
jgi:hypothetical protein